MKLDISFRHIQYGNQNLPVFGCYRFIIQQPSIYLQTKTVTSTQGSVFYVLNYSFNHILEYYVAKIRHARYAVDQWVFGDISFGDISFTFLYRKHFYSRNKTCC